MSSDGYHKKVRKVQIFAFCPANCNLGQAQSLLNIPLWNTKGPPKNSMCPVGKDISKCVETTKKMKKSVETLEAAAQNTQRFRDESSYNLHVSLFPTAWQSMKDILLQGLVQVH